MAVVRAQGATEYLVLLAVVLIIALVGIALLGFFPGTASEGRIAESQMYWRSATPLSVDAQGAYYATDGTYIWTIAYLRVKNNGNYPVRLVGMFADNGNGNYVEIYNYLNWDRGYVHEGMGNITLAPGEEACFGELWLPGRACKNHAVIFTPIKYIGLSAHYLNSGNPICNADGTGVLTIRGFGFEYVQYVEGQQTTKKQIGNAPFLVKCTGVCTYTSCS